MNLFFVGRTIKGGSVVSGVVRVDPSISPMNGGKPTYRDAGPDGTRRMTPAQRVLLAMLGLTTGFLSGFLGIGGGLLIVPVLMIAFSYPIKRAAGISLATIMLVSLVAVLAELVVKGSNVHWATAIVLTAGSLLGSWAGGRILLRLPETPVRLVFAVLILFASYQMAVATPAGAGASPWTLGGGSSIRYLFASGVGTLAGLTSVLFGIGGGTVMVPALSLLFRDLPFHAVRATSLVTIIPTATFGAYQHRGLGTVDASVVLRLIPTGLVGAVLGVISVNLLPPRPCRLAFAAFLVLAAARLLMADRRSDTADPAEAPSMATLA